LKFKRFLFVKTEGKGDGEFYRIPVTPLFFLFFFLLAIIVISHVVSNSQNSPQTLRKERLNSLQQSNRQLDSILRSLKVQMDTTEMNSEKIRAQSLELREKAALSVPEKPEKQKVREKFSHSFIQSYTDTINQFLVRSANIKPDTIWL